MAEIINYAEAWWSTIAGPSSFMKKVCNQLEDGNSVLAVISSSFPFRWIFRDYVANEFSTSLSVEYIDSAEELSDLDPGARIVDLLNPTKENDYNRCWSDADRFRILQELPGMGKALIWVRSIPDKHVAQWIAFLRQYLSFPGHRGVFLLELVTNEHVSDSLPQNISILNYANYVHQADLRLFTSMLATDLYPEQEQEYAATLSATLCNTDPEIAAKLLEGEDLCKVDALTKLIKIRDGFEESSRGLKRGWGDSEHPFTILDTKDRQELKNRIWTAQIRIAFPIIEMERRKLISHYEQELQEALRHAYLNKNNCEEWIENEDGDRITDPFDLEIGKLYFMTKRFRFPDGSDYYWKGTTLADRNRIAFLRERRNDFAHLRIVEEKDFLPLLYPEMTSTD